MPAPDERPEQDYAEAFFSLRAPRVAIVFPADTPHWDFFARKALWRANQLWGGAGFVLVPHNAGDVSDNVLRGVAAYDPDYVVGHQVSWKELLTAYPKARDMFVDEHGAKIDFQTLSLNDSAETAPAADPNTERARRTVADACQVYRRRHEPEASPTPDPKVPVRWDQAWTEPDESHTQLDDGEHLTATAAFGAQGEDMYLATPSDLAGEWGAWSAALIGVLKEPDPPALAVAEHAGGALTHAGSNVDDGPMVTSDGSPGLSASNPADAAEIAGWFYSHLDRRSRVVDPRPPTRFAHHPDGLQVAVDTTTLSSAWDRTTQALVPVGDAFARRRISLVVGDTANDFALALIYHRLYANTIWIHSHWSPKAEGKAGRSARTALTLLGYRIRQLGHAVITTTSVSKLLLDDVADIIGRTARQGEPAETSTAFGKSQPGATVGDDELTTSSEPAAPRVSTRRANSRPDPLRVELSATFPDQGMLHLAIAESYSTRLAVPVLRDDKAVLMTTTPPALRPSVATLSGTDAAWQVDLVLAGTTMPTGRGLDGEHLAASGDAKYETWIRSGNRGVSYESRRYDFVPAGANAEQRLARPRLRMLSLQEWCRAMATQVGYDVGWSDAGRRARLLERLWGDRGLMTTDFAGTFADLARAFFPAGKSSREAYPDGSGVLITGVGGFLTFPAIRDVLIPAAASGGKQQPTEVRDLEARERLDTYVTRGIIRRGLILGCRMCEAPNFVPVDEVRQNNRCPRCGSENSLTLEAWRTPANEPSWFYDLHQVARDFLRDNGYAPAQLAHHLSAGARIYADCAEMNLLRRGTRTSVAEVDLVSFADGKLLTAEVKTCDYIGNSTAERKAAANKRLHWAAVLQADEVLLASTEASWQRSSVEAMRTKLADAISSRTFAPDRTPRLRLINNLGKTNLTTTYVTL